MFQLLRINLKHTIIYIYIYVCVCVCVWYKLIKEERKEVRHERVEKIFYVIYT